MNQLSIVGVNVEAPAARGLDREPESGTRSFEFVGFRYATLVFGA